jgi:protein TonB
LAETTEETAAASRAVHPRGTSADEFLPAGSIPPEAATAIMTRLRGFVQYPERARLSGWEGKAILSFRLGADGQARDIEVVTSSGFPLLDRSAVSAVRRASPFPYRPHQEIALRLPVVYALH